MLGEGGYGVLLGRGILLFFVFVLILVMMMMVIFGLFFLGFFFGLRGIGI